MKTLKRSSFSSVGKGSCLQRSDSNYYNVLQGNTTSSPTGGLDGTLGFGAGASISPLTPQPGWSGELFRIPSWPLECPPPPLVFWIEWYGYQRAPRMAPWDSWQEVWFASSLPNLRFCRVGKYWVWIWGSKAFLKITKDQCKQIEHLY